MLSLPSDEDGAIKRLEVAQHVRYFLLFYCDQWGEGSWLSAISKKKCIPFWDTLRMINIITNLNSDNLTNVDLQAPLDYTPPPMRRHACSFLHRSDWKSPTIITYFNITREIKLFSDFRRGRKCGLRQVPTNSLHRSFGDKEALA